MLYNNHNEFYNLEQDIGLLDFLLRLQVFSSEYVKGPLTKIPHNNSIKEESCKNTYILYGLSTRLRKMVQYNTYPKNK